MSASARITSRWAGVARSHRDRVQAVVDFSAWAGSGSCLTRSLRVAEFLTEQRGIDPQL
jgi:hypothetical protein